MSRRPRTLAGTLLLLVGACSKSTPSSTTSVVLDDTMAARVGEQSIELQTVQRIASARHLAPKAALELAVEDALLAARAKSELPPYAPASHLERLTLARSLLEQIKDEAQAKGPPTEAELKQVVDGWWWELDRPELFRVTHAVVILDKGATPEQDESARMLAEKIRAAVLGAKPNEFRKRAESVDKGGLKVTIQDLNPVASDGRVVDIRRPPKRGGATAPYNAAFAAAAAALRDIGEISPVVKSSAGYHVMILTERVPAQRAPQDQLDAEVYEQRAGKVRGDLVAALRAGNNVSVLDQAMALTGLVRVAQ